MTLLLLLLLLVSTPPLVHGQSAGAAPGRPNEKPLPAAIPAAARALERSVAQEANRLVRNGEPERAVALGLAHLVPDSSDAELRAVLGWAYVARDQVCLPLPPKVEAFRAIGLGNRRCDLTIVPPATRDTVMAVFRAQAALAPDDVRSTLLPADYEARYGTPEALRRELAGLRRFRDRVALEEIQARLIEQLAVVKRPPAAGVIADHLLRTDPGTLDCAEMQSLITALVRSGNFHGVQVAVERVPADSLGERDFLPAMTMALVLGGRYQALWKLTKSIPFALDTISYYRYALTAVLAAAHFDTARAGKRLAHERLNEEAFPEDARSVLSELDSLLVHPNAPAGRWADLAGRTLLQDGWFNDVRDLLHSLALRRDPGFRRSLQALADDLMKREMPGLAAPRFEGLAGGRNPGLDRRWDPRRPRFLRQAAEAYFAAEEDSLCLVLLDLIPERTAEDELMAGVMALRSGDLRAAAEAFVRARRLAKPAAMVDAASRLVAITASGGR